MDKSAEVNILGYHQIPLSNLVLPAHYNKLINRIKKSVSEGFEIKTVGDILNFEPYQFLSFKGIGKQYVNTLIEFKKDLPQLLQHFTSESNTFDKEGIFTPPINSYYKNTPLSHLSLSPKYQKLIKRILKLNYQVRTVQDITEINVNEFSQIPGIGKVYVELLVNLINTLSSKETNQAKDDIEEIKNIIPDIILTTEQLETPLNQLAIFIPYKKLIKRISSNLVNVTTVQDLLNLDPVSFSKLNYVGCKYVNQLVELQKSLPSFLETKTQKFTLLKEKYSIPFNDIDNTLIEDVENYLWTLDEMKMNIALSRWGFNHTHESLETIGNRFKLTRERIRQIEKNINNNLLINLTILPKILWANIREK